MVAKNDLVWMTGGPQGSGVDSGANIFARACCYGGLYVFGNREYHSNIKGLHSYFQIRVAEQPVRSHRSFVDLLAAFDAETLVRHRSEVAGQGGIVYDPAYDATRIRDIPTLEREFVNEFVPALKQKGFGETVGDILEDARKDGIRTYPVPYMTLVNEIAGKLGESKVSRVTRVINVLVLGVSFAILDSDLTLLEKAVRSIFGSKPKIADMNVLASQMAYDYAKKNLDTNLGIRLEKVKVNEDRIFLMGSQAVALGKLAGGCRFQTYYPITPAADESEYLEANEKLDLVAGKTHTPQSGEESSAREGGSIVIVQTEDEIAAINMASGAALTGVRASTCTSGPGFSLMVEGLGWAGMNEVPVVITYYQRGAPSTGLPTRHGQDDLRFAIHASHGEFPRIVLASGDIQECFYDAALSFNYAERFQMPVIHLIDKALANSSNTYPTFDISNMRIDRGELLDPTELQRLVQERGQYKRFQLTESGISPRIPLGTTGTVFWNTGDERDESGHICENPTNRTKMMEKRMRKLELVEREIPASEKLNFFEEDGAATVISWGSPKGAIIEAQNRLKAEGINVNFLQVRLIHPFPTEDVSRLLGRAKKIIDVEMNYSGQLAGIVREETGIPIDDLVLKYNGRPMTSDEVYDAIRNVLSGKSTKRQVLTHGS
ncbi:MAG: 2-oxoacid:ferredoxin oxidoreductase subunit alpha [Candidatus Bathyarchaeia archaeon]